MSNSLDELRDLLDDVAHERATAVRADASAAWKEGRRRRLGNRVSVAVMAVVAVIGGALALSPVLAGLPAVTSPASGADAVATKYPARLDHAYWDDEEPRVTGALAGVVHRQSDGKFDWYSVSPEGHLWRIDASDEAVPSLSPDGSHLGYMRGSFLDATYVIVDQVDGTTTRFPQIGAGSFDPNVEDFDDDHRFFHGGQSPAFWSPDGTSLLLRVSLSNPDDPEPDPAGAVLGTDGSFVSVPLPAGASEGISPLGWIDEHHVAFAAAPAAKPAGLRIWIVDIRSGRGVRDFPHDGGTKYRETYQSFGTVSPDGNELATAIRSEDGDIRFYSMRGPTSGDLVATLPPVTAPADSCQPSWSSAEFYVPTYPTPDGDNAILVRANGGVTIQADPRLDIACSTWARTALDGTAHDSLGSRIFGRSDTWLSWHWREVTSSTLLGIAVSVGIGLLVRRRPRWAGRTRR